MDRLDSLKQAVTELYEAQNPQRSDWTEWMWQHHVGIVASNAAELAKRFDANAELAEAAAWLHDIADAVMQRHDERHEKECFRIARELLKNAGYSANEIKLVVDDALRLHSCHDGQRPVSVEGQILATADALAHLKTDFYVYAVWAMSREGASLASTKEYAISKSKRDFFDKICFDVVRDETRADFDAMQRLFGR